MEYEINFRFNIIYCIENLYKLKRNYIESIFSVRERLSEFKANELFFHRVGFSQTCHRKYIKEANIIYRTSYCFCFELLTPRS